MTFLPDTDAGDDRTKVTQHTTTSAMPARIQPSSFQTASRRFTVVRLSAMLGADPGHRETVVLVLRSQCQRYSLWCTHTRRDHAGTRVCTRGR